MEDELTFCSECNVRVYKKDHPKAYQYDYCQEHWEAEQKRKKEAKPYTGPSVEDIKQKEKEFDNYSPLIRLKGFGVRQRQAEAAVRYYIERPGSLDEYSTSLPFDSFSLYLYGPAGTGKTVLAAALMYQYARVVASGSRWKGGMGSHNSFNPDKYLFIRVPEFLSELRTSFGRKRTFSEEDQTSTVDPVERMTKAHFLVLDDFGAEKVSDWTLSTLYVVIDARYSEYRPTIFTSNLSLKRVAEVFGDSRVPSRIEEWCKVAELSEEHLRSFGRR